MLFGNDHGWLEKFLADYHIVISHKQHSNALTVIGEKEKITNAREKLTNFETVCINVPTYF